MWAGRRISRLEMEKNKKYPRNPTDYIRIDLKISTHRHTINYQKLNTENSKRSNSLCSSDS